MNIDVCQRWNDRRGTYRPAVETIDPRAYDVSLIADDVTAKRFVVRHHYSASYPAARARVGLHRRGELVGVLVASHPVQDAVLKCLPGTDKATKAELGRFVLLDDVPSNGETWFLARAFDLLRREVGIESLVSFSDPVPRSDARGRRVFIGHVGTIYQASNGRFVGRGRGGVLHLLPDGRVLPRRAISKIRAGHRGWLHASRALVRFGAERLESESDGADWLEEWLPKLTRPLRHPGNLKYLFGLDRRARKHLPASLPYPKLSPWRK